MKVTLRKFLEIVGRDFIDPWMCILYVNEEKITFSNIYDWICDIENLNPYMDYEIYGFEQEVIWGHIETQYIYLREMEEQNETLG